jgi:hypothetical protein
MSVGRPIAKPPINRPADAPRPERPKPAPHQPMVIEPPKPAQPPNTQRN